MNGAAPGKAAAVPRPQTSGTADVQGGRLRRGSARAVARVWLDRSPRREPARDRNGAWACFRQRKVRPCRSFQIEADYLEVGAVSRRGPRGGKMFWRMRSNLHLNLYVNWSFGEVRDASRDFPM
jgi:hypothetical protein